MKRRQVTLAGSIILVLLVATALRGHALLSACYNQQGRLNLNAALLAPSLSPEARQQRLMAAGQAFQQALRWDPSNAAAYRNLGTIYAGWGEPAAAAEALEKAVALGLEDPQAGLQLADALLVLGREDEAVAAWQRAAAGAYLLAEARRHLRAGDLAAAEATQRLAARVEPESAEAYRVLGEIYAGRGRTAEAVAAYQTALHLDTDEIQREVTRAQIYVWQGHRQDAIAIYEDLVTLRPATLAYRLRLAELYAADRQLDAALREYQAVLATDPVNVAATEGIRRLSRARP
jgi:tetratricopeptide (TPR) repeat protein